MAAPAQLEAVLLKNTSLSEDQVLSLLDMAADKGGTVRDLLMKKETSAADDLLAELAASMGMGYIKEIPINEVQMDLIATIPINFAKKHEVLPYKDDGNQVLILTTNPLNVKILDDLRVLYKKRTTPLLT